MPAAAPAAISSIAVACGRKARSRAGCVSVISIARRARSAAPMRGRRGLPNPTSVSGGGSDARIDIAASPSDERQNCLHQSPRCLPWSRHTGMASVVRTPRSLRRCSRRFFWLVSAPSRSYTAQIQRSRRISDAVRCVAAFIRAPRCFALQPYCLPSALRIRRRRSPFSRLRLPGRQSSGRRRKRRPRRGQLRRQRVDLASASFPSSVIAWR